MAEGGPSKDMSSQKVMNIHVWIAWNMYKNLQKLQEVEPDLVIFSWHIANLTFLL